MKRPKWLWSQVRRFSVMSRADGTLLVEPDYYSKWTPEEGGGPGLLTRLALAKWIELRLNGKPTATVTVEDAV